MTSPPSQQAQSSQQSPAQQQAQAPQVARSARRSLLHCPFLARPGSARRLFVRTLTTYEG
jgi:hypothetical protein